MSDHENPMNSQQFEVHIRATTAEIWQALTDPAITPLYYFESIVESSWHVGSTIRYRLPDGSVAIEGKVIAIDPSWRLVTTFSANWDPDVALDAPHQVTWITIPAGDGCILRVVHEGFSGKTSTFVQISEGMPVLLEAFKAYLERRHSPE